MKPVIVIPAYKPDHSLVSLAATLVNSKAELIIINDGSGPSYATLFEQLAKLPSTTVLHHAVNLGKGQALKTAFNHFLIHFPNTTLGVITADADGQHLPEDIFHVWEAFTKRPNDLTLGVRTFSKTIPWRSRFGNTFTRSVFTFLIGQSVQDTQTGLRAIPRHFLATLLKTPSTGYDFELDMLILASKNMKIQEVPIETVYLNDNKGSHFNPFIDSLKIYFVFFRFLAFSIVSGLLDYFAFSFAFFICQNILLSESLARLFSGTCNFLFNKELVFKSKQKIAPEAFKYALLCAANLAFSYGFISSLVYLGVSVYASKMIALIGLFVANFAIQRLMIFGRVEETALSS